MKLFKIALLIIAVLLALADPELMALAIVIGFFYLAWKILRGIFGKKCSVCKSRKFSTVNTRKSLDNVKYHGQKLQSYKARQVTTKTYQCKKCGFTFDKNNYTNLYGGGTPSV